MSFTIGEHFVGIHLIASGKHLHGFSHAHRRLEKALALRVLTQKGQHLFVVFRKFIKPFAVGLKFSFLTHGY